MYNNYYGGYYYTYEATMQPLFGNARLYLDESYRSSALIFTILVGLLTFALVLVAAIFIKKARPLGVVTAIAQPIGAFAAMKWVLAFAGLDFSSLYITVTGSSQQDALNKLYEKVGDNFVEYVLPGVISCLFWGFIVTAVTVITIVYAAMLFKEKGKGLAVCAFVFLLLRFLFVSPVEIFSYILGSPSQEIQTLWDMFFRFMFILPPLFIAIAGLLNIGKKKPDVEAEATETVEQQPAEVQAEAPAVETESKLEIDEQLNELSKKEYKW